MPDKLLSAAVFGTGWYGNNYDGKVADHLDWIGLMTNDLTGSWNGPPVRPHTALYHLRQGTRAPVYPGAGPLNPTRTSSKALGRLGDRLRQPTRWRTTPSGPSRTACGTGRTPSTRTGRDPASGCRGPSSRSGSRCMGTISPVGRGPSGARTGIRLAGRPDRARFSLDTGMRLRVQCESRRAGRGPG